MLLNYGHARISWDGDDYVLIPSFSNIAKLGKPKEIIDLFKRFVTLPSGLRKWHIAMQVLDACCDKDLPIKLVGHTVFSERKQKFLYCQPAHGLPMFSDCITLADHCLRHGVCGVYESGNVDDDAKPVAEFDAYWFMEMAMKHLSVSRSEASTMTMTEFARRMAVEFPDENQTKMSERDRKIADFDAAIKWHKEQNKGAH